MFSAEGWRLNGAIHQLLLIREADDELAWSIGVHPWFGSRLAANPTRVGDHLLHGAKKELAGGAFRVKGLIPDFLSPLAIVDGPRSTGFMVEHQAPVRSATG